MNWKWFAVKTLYRTTIEESPKVKDIWCTDKYDMIEERVLLCKARNHDEAIGIADKEAQEYVGLNKMKNIYGQKVRTEIIKNYKSFELNDELGKNSEVYSSTYLLEKSTTTEKLEENHFGLELENDSKLRRNFLNEDFASIVSMQKE